MYLSALLTILIFGANAIALALTSRRQNGCFSLDKGVCLGRQADAGNATLAIINACGQVTDCIPGQTDHGRGRVKGTVKGFPYTATLYVGDDCGGVSFWSTQGCVKLFNGYVDERCEKQYPTTAPGLYQLGYETATCDGSFVSFNLGG